MEKRRSGSVLGDDEVNASVLIIVRRCCRSLLAIKTDSTLDGRQRDESALPIAAQQETQSGIESAVVRMECEQVLGKDQIHESITIEVGDTDTKHGRPLGLPRQWMDLEVLVAIQQNHRVEVRRSCSL